MGWSELARQGFALAATIADDPAAGLAAGGLMPASAAELATVAVELAALPVDERRQRIRRIAALLNPRIPDRVALPPRALALLATGPGAEGARFLQGASPLPPPGHLPEPGLRALVRMVAARSPNRPDSGEKGST